MTSTTRLLRALSALAMLWVHLVESSSRSPYSGQARLYSEDGHLFIVGGIHSNITLKTSGDGFVNINNHDLLHITELAANSAAFVHGFKKNVLPELLALQGGGDGSRVMARLRVLEAALSVTNTTIVGGNAQEKQKIRLLTRRVNLLTRSMRVLRLLLVKDECDSGPCQNGGICQDLFDGYHCRCTPQWQGTMCELDVDECSRLSGTGLGCQNGGTCRNLAGSYACTCPSGWYGLHCTQRTYDCSLQSSGELCGHGVCVNQGGTGRGFICMCDQGWSKRETDGSCTIDVDECARAHSPCSHDPPVTCVNTPGSFQCSPCPTGYRGNGYQCADIDECQNNNGGCSASPMVQCINTMGSRVCGPCPPGYSGDGTICSAAGGKCAVANGGCHPKAACVDNQALSYVKCVCPTGYVGTGLGPDGCIPGLAPPSDVSRCKNNPCQNGGTCLSLPSGRYMCNCRIEFSGPNCTQRTDPCSSSPCKNGATCESVRFFHLEHYRCFCPRGFSGVNCASQQEGCIGRFYQYNGTVSVTRSMTRPVTCAWTIISPNQTKVINITFTDIDIGLRHTTRCFSNFVEIYDGINSAAPLIGQYCGNKVPPPIISSHPVILITTKLLYSEGHFRLNWTTVPRKCGGLLNATTHGTISSPGSPGNYPHNVHCIWTVIAPLGKRIRFTFFSLDLEKHVNCSFDYLEVKNGGSDQGPTLRKYCTSSLPEPLLTSGNKAVLIFHSDSSRSAKGFQISYSPSEGMPGCGGAFTNPNGVIKPPSKSGGIEYLDNLSCEWVISLPVGERIFINVQSLNIEANDFCNYDYLAIYDGPTKESGLVGRWCGKKAVMPFTSTSNEVLVHFESDINNNEGGFTLNYKAVCGGLWSAPSGIIQSPYYPFHYPEERTCTYTIQQPTGYAIKLNFLDFDVEDSNLCTYDSLAIYNGNDENSPLMGKYCSPRKPGLIISTHNFLHLVFKTDVNNGGRGFKANYTAVDISCGGILTGKSGTISSPKYPEQYPLNQDCTWIIAAPLGTMIQLTWLSFNVEKSYNCSRDWVTIYDKNRILAYSGQLGSRYCGNVIPPSMTSSSNIMSIKLHTDRSVAAPGFSATYVATDASAMCSGNFFTVMGEIRSPNFPNGYPEKLDCVWTITVPNGQQIELSVKAFSIEPPQGSKCKSDYLEIRNGGFDNSPLIKRYCGSEIDKTIVSVANRLYVRFISDTGTSAPGFRFTWNGAIMGCGGTLTSPSGSIVSPNYPQPYGKNGECVYKIAVSLGSNIQLIIVDVDLEEHATCALDYVQIFDGGSKLAPKLVKLCSQPHSPSVMSKGNLMYILFRSDTSRQGRGFHFKYSTACNVTLNGFSGTVESPGFPDKDATPRECFWKIKAPLGNKINISFSHFQLGGPDTSCSDAYLKFSEGSSGSTEPSHMIGQFCNTTVKPFKLTSSTTDVYIYFKTTEKNLYPTLFRFEWIVSGCGGVFRRQLKGELSSPGYPIAYPHEVVCEWYLSVHLGSSISITIDDLQLEDSDGCRFDSLEIYGGSDDTAPRLVKSCKKLTSADGTVITTSGNNAFIRFITDNSYKARGFHATYQELPNSKCGGKFISESGLIHSHNYPQNYDPHDDCIYLIGVDSQHRINLTFTDFDIDALDSNCTNGYVKVYDGDSQDSPLLKNLCGNTLPSSIFSTSNKMLVRHKSDGFATAKGFSALYKPECGANLMTNSSGTLIFSEMNTTLDWTYESKCKWIIKSTIPNAKITIQFVLLDIPVLYYRTIFTLPSNSIVQPGVNIFAGDDSDAPFYGHYSQTRLPPAFVVQSSSVTVVYKATDSKQGRFTMDYSIKDTNCGGSLHGEAGNINSPNDPDPYPNNIECVWILNAAPGSNMLLEFTKFDLQQSSLCNDDYVEVRQRSGSGPLLGVFCGTTMPRRIQSNSSLWIKFRSGLEGTATGFTASYSLGLESLLEGLMGQLGSPFFPLICYSNNAYGWRITVKPGHIIRISFTDFYIDNYGESTEEECFNRLMVYDGVDQSAPLLKELCGLAVPQPFSSGSNVVYIYMNQILGSGYHFLLNWLQVEKVPPSETSVAEGKVIEFAKDKALYNFSSPGYPNGYGVNLNYEWIFQALPGDHVRLAFSVINLETSPLCSSDSITIYNGELDGSNKQWTETNKLCNENDTGKVYDGSRLVKVVFSTDLSINKTGFSGRAEADCGGDVTGPTGVLSEGPYTTCQWNITVRPSRTIKIIFTKFQLHGSPPCSDGNYILLRDGGRPDSPLLGAGKYCGTSLKDINIPETTSNRLYVFYQTRASEGMVMKFEEKSVSCGGEIMLSKSWAIETISSPNYPNIPPPHTECIWRAYVPSGESLHFDVTERFDMTPSLGCTKEYLELRDGSSENSHLIGRYCSSTPNYVTTEGNALYIKYFTDTDDPKDGFRGTISMSKCGGTLYDTGSGSLMSPGYPSTYENNLNCTWKLVTSENKRFLLNISLAMGRSRFTCGSQKVDTVTVSEIMKENIRIIGPETVTLCGTRTMLLLSETNEIIINFRSREIMPRTSKGYFIINYSTKLQRCGGTLNLPSGVIRSLGYPVTLAGQCSWRITVPQGRRVTLNLLDFDLEKMIDFSTPQRLTMYNGFTYQNLITTLAGDMPQQKVYQSSGNEMLLVYSSNRGSSHRGFLANYTSLQPAICGGKMDATKNGSLSMTTKEKEAYYCVWEFVNLSPAIPSTITFIYNGTSNSFFKDYPKSCYYAFSFISFGDRRIPFGIFCSETKPNQPYIISKPNVFSVVKMAKPNMKSPGKNVSFSLSWKIDSCGSTLKDIAEAEIKSPGEAAYPANTDCVWSVSVPQGSVIRIHFDKFDLEADCSHDYLKIFNGPSPRSPMISHHCGNIVPADIITQRNVVWILFHSDDSNQKSGFKLQITQVDSGCGGVLHGITGLIQSPSYPSNYKNNIECDWEIRVDGGFHIGLVFKERFYIEDSTGCQNDYLKVSDYIDGKWKLMNTLCGREIPKASFNSTSNRMRVFFKTNGNITGDGFKAIWAVNCGGVINIKGPGHIYSPEWPVNYLGYTSCNYTLSAPKQMITARFEKFNLEESSSQGCYYDKLQIWTKKYETDTFESSGIFCDINKPPDHSSLGQMIIQFTSAQMWLSHSQFSIAYDISTCGGEIKEETVISQPRVKDISVETQCIWNITGPSDRVVLLELINLRLPMYPHCAVENIIIWDVHNPAINNRTLLARLCGRADAFPVFRSSGNRMQVVFNGHLQENRGFSAVVSFAYGEKVGCGGKFILDGSKTDSQITITSPDIDKDGKYEANMDCHWTVSTPSDSTLIATFVKMDIAPCMQKAANSSRSVIQTTTARCCDALEVYDGPSERYEQIGRYCSANNTRSIASSSNYLSFRFASNEIGQGEGFKINVSPHISVCGSSILTVEDSPKILTSPNYPESYPINVHCRWVLVGSGYQSINVHFIEMDIEETSDCSHDRLEVFDELKGPWRFKNNATQRQLFSGSFQYSKSNPEPNNLNILCGKSTPLNYYSSSNRAVVRFISDSQQTQKGFKIQYSYATCSRNYTAPSGRIVVKNKKNCTFSIEAQKNHSISVYFSSMSIYRSYGANDCSNTLEVFEGTKNISRLCGYGAQPPLFSSNNSLTFVLTLVSTKSAYIDLSYTTTDKGRGCGGTFHNEVGAFTSPMYPGNYRNYSYCCWGVTVPLPGVPSFIFYEFDLGLRSTCNTDYVELFDISDSGEKISRASYCGGDEPARFQGRSQTAGLCYKSSIHNSGLGWSVRWSSVTNVEGDTAAGT